MQLTQESIDPQGMNVKCRVQGANWDCGKENAVRTNEVALPLEFNANSVKMIIAKNPLSRQQGI